MSEQEKKTEELIFEAAKEVFTEKGYDGARMEEISKRAGINKALLHYYYRSKEKLFSAIFEGVFSQLMPFVFKKLDSDAPLFEKIEFFVDKYISLISANPHIPMFVLSELNRNPELLKSLFTKMITQGKINPYEKLAKAIEEEVAKGTIEPIDPQQLIINAIALCIFPIIARPIVQGIMFNDDKESYNRFLESRKKEVTLFIINSIKKR